MFIRTVRTYVLYTRVYVPDAIESSVRIPFPVDFSDFRPPGRIMVQSYRGRRDDNLRRSGRERRGDDRRGGKTMIREGERRGQEERW